MKKISFCFVTKRDTPSPILYHPSAKLFNLNEIMNDPAEIDLASFQIKLLATKIQIDPLSSSLDHQYEFYHRQI